MLFVAYCCLQKNVNCGCQRQSWIYIVHKRKASNALKYHHHHLRVAGECHVVVPTPWPWQTTSCLLSPVGSSWSLRSWHVLKTHTLHNRARQQMNQMIKTTVQCVHRSLEPQPSVCHATDQQTCRWSVGQDSSVVTVLKIW